MSHQVRLSSFNFTNLEYILQAIAQEGLKTTDKMHGYSSSWMKGQVYATDPVHGKQTLVMGIEAGNHYARTSPCGITSNADGTYSFVGDGYNINYNGYALEELGVRLNQRYQIVKAIDQASTFGWETISVPENLNHYTQQNSEIEMVFEKQQQQLVQAYL
jgi:hypothetical protein